MRSTKSWAWIRAWSLTLNLPREDLQSGRSFGDWLKCLGYPLRKSSVYTEQRSPPIAAWRLALSADSPQELYWLVHEIRDQCNKQWQQLALSKQVGEMGYRKAAENIKNLQTFVSSINSSTDQKAISEVQARIQVETVRMQNEQMKIATIAAMEEADRRMKQQRSIDSFNNGLSKGSQGGIRF